MMESERVCASVDHLQQFGKAKKKHKLIYDAIGDLIRKIKIKMHEASFLNCEVCSSVQENINLQGGMIESLKSDLARRKMKVAFFGGTSSGKTTTLNAMIGRELLPSGMGDTTSCFIQIEKIAQENDNADSNGRENPNPSSGPKGDERSAPSYFFVKQVECQELEASYNSLLDERQPLEKDTLEDLCAARSKRSLDSTYLVEIHLSEDDVTEDHMLNYDLQIMDCPGITKCRELGERVKAFCADSDVHVFIMNPKTVMTPEERDHFLEVGKRLPKPDIVVGFTQWDLSARERHPEEVKARHVDEVFKMLSELDVVETREEAEERCFFYSGIEALDFALGETKFLAYGWEERFTAFKKLISKIQERATSAGKSAKLDLNRNTCHEILHRCIECISEIQRQAEVCSSTADLENESVQTKLESFDKKMTEFNQEKGNLRQRALGIIDKSISGCMADMSQTLRRSTDEVSFEEDQVHQYAERAIVLWYRKILNAFHLATDNTCEQYSREVSDCYEKGMKKFDPNFPRRYSSLSREDSQDAGSTPTSPIPTAAVQRVLSGIHASPFWTSLATTRRRLRSVEADEERNVVIRGMAAATGVFFMQVRQWIRSSIEQKLERLATLERDSLICPLIRRKYHQEVEEFCDNSDEHYKEECDRLHGILKRQCSEAQEKQAQIRNFSTDLVNLRCEAEQIQLAIMKHCNRQHKIASATEENVDDHALLDAV